MANRIQPADQKGSCTNLLKAMDIVGLTDTIGEPGTYTCFQHLDLFDLQIGILPGNFSAKEIEDLFKAAAYTNTHVQEAPKLAA